MKAFKRCVKRAPKPPLLSLQVSISQALAIENVAYYNFFLNPH